MPTYQQYQQQFVQDLVDPSSSARVQVKTSTMPASVQALVDALPYYGELAFQQAHRGALSNLLEVNLPNNSIAAQPFDYGFGYSSSYSYNGSYSGYRDAFYHGIAQTGPASAVAAQVQAVNGSLNGGWWGNYGVAALTDAVRQILGFSLDSGKLSGDLSNYNGSLLPALSASFLAVLMTGFAPTTDAYNAIVNAGQKGQALADLMSAISNQQFTADLNEAIAMGGDSTNAAVWFEYNLWMTLKMLGSTNVDAAITQFKSEGLTVPSQVGPGSWWTGGYTSWYYALSGSDVSSAARSTITAGMPETEMTVYSGSPFPVTTYPTVANGYSQSLCYWGALNWYQPPPSSCFGKGTGVLMADGAVKSIEEVRVGDEVQSSVGPKKVVLIETPKRQGRILYKVNDLNVFATSAHPFRSATDAGPLRRAIDPWALVDAIPTMTATGVGALDTGTELAGISAGGPSNVSVSRVSSFEPDDEQEVVYDLFLESWDRGFPAYYVGGPEAFLAVESESPDPLYDLPSTLAVVAAMAIALPTCRTHVKDPSADLAGILRQIDPAEKAPMARKAAMGVSERKSDRPGIPGPDFFMLDGEWDPYASLLETYLVRNFGRTFRREAATGWSDRARTTSPDDRYSVIVHDIELVGDESVPAGAQVEIRVKLRGWDSSDDTVRSLSIAASAKPSWHLTPDEALDFGEIGSSVQKASLELAIDVDGVLLGECRTTVTGSAMTDRPSEHFIFSPSGKVIGRIAIDQRRVSASGLKQEQVLLGRWDSHQSTALAVSMGRQIGYELVASVAS